MSVNKKEQAFRQKMFNRVWQHFIVEKNSPALAFNEKVNNNICVYDSPEGLRCAIGIQPEFRKAAKLDGLELSPTLVGSIITLMDDHENIRNLYKNHRSFVWQLQQLHDFNFYGRSSEEGTSFATKFAKQWELEIPTTTTTKAKEKK